MAKRKSGSLPKIIAIIVVAVVLIFGVGLIYRFTNGFNEDFKTFYVEHDGKQILSTESTSRLAKGEDHRFDVKYTFDFVNSETRDYSVKVYSNISKDEIFSYTVNGLELPYKNGIDLTAAFEIEKTETYFTVKIPGDASLQSVLQALYAGKTVTVDETIEYKQPYLYTLVVSSYNESVVYYIDFALYVPVHGISIAGGGDSDSLQFGGEKNEYWIAYDIMEAPGITVHSIQFAYEGERVSFTVEAKKGFELQRVILSDWDANPKHEEELQAVNGVYTFEMPSADVRIKVYSIRVASATSIGGEI